MQEFVIPFAPLTVKIAVGIPLGVLTGLGLWWGTRMLVRSLREKAGSPVFFGIVILASLGAGLLFLAVETSQPCIVSKTGFVYGAVPPTYRSVTIPWSEVSRVDCFIRHNGRDITGLVIYSGAERYQFGDASQPLAAVRDFIETRVPAGVVVPCKTTFRD